jgi:uncharacterized delta-60 repeat protein
MKMFTRFILISAGFFGASILTTAQISMLDNTFGTDGKAAAIFNGNVDEAFSIAIQTDGKIIEAGWTTDSSGNYAFAVARFSQNGSLDNTFGTNGLVSTFISSGDNTNDKAYSVAIQPDGKIVVAGYSNDTTGGSIYSAFAVARFNPNGTLDNTFGTKGSVRTFINGGGGIDVGRHVLIQPNGKIVVVGMSLIISVFYDLGVARFNSDGKMDNTFGTNGTTSVTAIGDPYDYNSFSCALQPDGKIVVAGSSISFDNVSNVPFTVARLNSNGTLDNTFGVNGTSGTYISGGDSTNDVCNSVSIQPDGKIVLAGYSGRASLTLINDIAFAVARFDSNGTKDRTFGTNGTVRAYINGTDSTSDRAYSAAIQSDGKIVVGGGSSSSLLGQSTFAIARFDSNGTKDSTFGTNGTVTTTFGSDMNVSDAAMSIALQTDGKILAGGYSQIASGSTVFVLARYLTSNMTGINEDKSLPKSFALEQNYPNPFNPSTTIKYSIPKFGLVTIKIYDILGREVTTLINEEKNAGNYSVEFNASMLASGVYLYRISAGSFEETKKLVLIK